VPPFPSTNLKGHIASSPESFHVKRNLQKKTKTSDPRFPVSLTSLYPCLTPSFLGSSSSFVCLPRSAVLSLPPRPSTLPHTRETLFAPDSLLSHAHFSSSSSFICFSSSLSTTLSLSLPTRSLMFTLSLDDSDLLGFFVCLFACFVCNRCLLRCMHI